MSNTTILDRNDIQMAKAAVAAYKQTCISLYAQLTNTINALRQSGFIGDASNGFDAFYAAIAPALDANLCGDGNSVTTLLDKLLTSVESALLDTVDPDLDKANRGAADPQTANVAQN